MNGTSKKPIRPIRQQVPNINQNRRTGIIFRTRRQNRHSRPRTVLLEYFKTSLACETEQQRDGAVVGVGAGADVICRVGRTTWRRVAKEAQDGTASRGGFEMRRGEEIVYLGVFVRNAKSGKSEQGE